METQPPPAPYNRTSTALSTSQCTFPLLVARFADSLTFRSYFYLTRAFNSTSGNITALVDQMEKVRQECKDIHVLTTFSENHDLPRFASYTKDMSVSSSLRLFEGRALTIF
jgi:hypothetical protein